MDITESEREQLIIETATRLIEVVEALKNRLPLPDLILRESRLDHTWKRIEIVS